MNTYDHYLSLGINCEAAFQFRRVLGVDHPSFFNWNVTPIDSLNNLLLAEFDRIADYDKLLFEGNGTLVRDLRYNYQFHWVGDNIESLDNGSEIFKSNKSRLIYLTSKFRKTLASGDSVAFFYTLNGDTAVTKLFETYSILRNKFQCYNFSIIAITDGSVSADENILPSNFFIRKVERFAPWHDATDAHVKSWDAIFREFPATTGLRLAGY